MRVFEDNWRWMTAWLIVGLLIYFGYGYRQRVALKSGASRAHSRP